MTTDTNPRAVIGGNNPPSTIFDEIDDLFQTAKDFADGEPIGDEAMHDTISAIRDQIHELGKRADAMRADEKKPHDDAAKAVQEKYKPWLAKVTTAKAALGDLLAAWRQRVLAEKQAEARRKQEEAARLAEEAQAAIRATSGNLAARVDAEELLAHAKDVEKDAKRAEKAATTSTGLRTVWRAELVDESKALDWAYSRAPDAFRQLVQGMADTVVRAGMRSVPGFTVTETKVV